MDSVIWHGALHDILVRILRGKPNRGAELGDISHKGITYRIYRDNDRVGFVPVATGLNGAYGSSSFEGTLASGNFNDAVAPTVEEIPEPFGAPDEPVVEEVPKKKGK